MKMHYIQGHGDMHSVVLEGELDAFGCQQIRSELEQAAAQITQGSLQINLEGVTFIDSSGVGAIVFLFKRLAARNCHMFLSGVHGQPRELLENLRVHEAIEVRWLNTEAAPKAASISDLA